MMILKTKKIIAREILILFSIPVIILVTHFSLKYWNDFIDNKIKINNKEIKNITIEIKELENKLMVEIPYVYNKKYNSELKLLIASKKEKSRNFYIEKWKLPHKKYKTKKSVKKLSKLLIGLYLLRVFVFLIYWSIKQLKS